VTASHDIAWRRTACGHAGASVLRLAALLVLALGSMLAMPASRAVPADETSIHAAYVINFARYSKWPGTEASTEPFVIAALGPPESIAALKRLAAQAGGSAGRRIAVRPISLNTVAPPQDRAVRAVQSRLDGAHVVYVAASHRAWNDAVIAATRDRAVLTVGVGSDFTATGGMFGLIEDRGRVRFTANEDVIRRSPIQVSARVLMLARMPRAREG
jgi:hypothetical protein